VLVVAVAVVVAVAAKEAFDSAIELAQTVSVVVEAESAAFAGEPPFAAAKIQAAAQVVPAAGTRAFAALAAHIAAYKEAVAPEQWSPPNQMDP
jgi:hypothetical protein